jgi:hypothetical protein
MIPVVNYERMERLKPPPITNIPFNMNTLSVIFIIIGGLFLYRRYVVVKSGRERSRI